MHHLLRLTGLCCALWLPFGMAEEGDVERRAQQLREQLDNLTREIGEFKAELDRTRDERTRIEDELRRNETEMGELLKHIREIEQELDQGESKLDTLEDERTELNDAKVEQQDYIVRQIRQAWALRNQESLKVLLNQQDPLEIGRMLNYYQYLNRARVEQVGRYQELLDALARVQERILDQTERLRADRAMLAERQRELGVARASRETTLARLNAAIRSKGNALEKLTQDRSDLENLLERIEQEIAAIPDIDDVTPFPNLEGQLLLPVSGIITHKFGSRRVEDRIRWQGVFIETREGTSVHAVHHGRVVFSDWLRGFGLLLIINHGDGYMSLYGHNQTLEREAGDWVATDEVVSTAGNTGGLDRFGLYFEIRQNGRPRNPEVWCQARA